MTVYKYGNPESRLVLIQPTGSHEISMLEREKSEIIKAIGEDVLLLAVNVDNWNSDLSPWNAPAVFGDEPFGSGAANTLDEIVGLCEDKSKKYFLGGYSLAGLFSLWAAYQTDIFCGIAAASPSVWFPNFISYMKENTVKCSCVYLSLGDRESKTRNQVMATVADRIKECESILTKQNTVCTLEWNEGNHFKDADLRTARAFAWVIKNNTETDS